MDKLLRSHPIMDPDIADLGAAAGEHRDCWVLQLCYFQPSAHTGAPPWFDQ